MSFSFRSKKATDAKGRPFLFFFRFHFLLNCFSVIVTYLVRPAAIIVLTSSVQRTIFCFELLLLSLFFRKFFSLLLLFIVTTTISRRLILLSSSSLLSMLFIIIFDDLSHFLRLCNNCRSWPLGHEKLLMRSLSNNDNFGNFIFHLEDRINRCCSNRTRKCRCNDQRIREIVVALIERSVKHYFAINGEIKAE